MNLLLDFSSARHCPPYQVQFFRLARYISVTGFTTHKMFALATRWKGWDGSKCSFESPVLGLAIDMGETLPHLAITLIPAVSPAVLLYDKAALGLGDIQQAEGRRHVAQGTGNWVEEFSATAQPWFDRGDVCVPECTCTGLSVQGWEDTQEQSVAHGQDQLKLVSHKHSIKKLCITS